MNLEKIRVAKEITRPQLAKKVGCHKQQIYAFERTDAAIPVKYVSKYAAALRLTQKYLLSLNAKKKKVKARR